MLLEELKGSDIFEDSETECKARLDRENIIGWLKSVVGFANAKGGIFYIGVEDKSHKLIGFTRKEADNERNFFNNAVNEHLSPLPSYKISFTKYEKGTKELYILEITVESSKVKPVILKHKGIPSIFMRREGQTTGATYEEIINMSIKSQNVQYDSLYSYEKYDRKDFSQLFSFFSEHNEGNSKLTDKALEALGFFNKEKHLANGAVLFKDDYKGGKTLVQASVFSGFNKGSERIVSVNRFDGNITSSIGFMMEFVMQRMNHSMIKLENTRVNVDAFPVRALFEGIINAVAHRDYFLDGTQIQIDIFKDRLEITSPGGFFQGPDIKTTYDLSSVISKRRNEVICGVLVKCNVMEAAGTGFDKIIEEYSDADIQHKPFIRSASDHFTLCLPDLTFTEGVKNEGLPQLEFEPVRNGSVHDKKILEYCYTYAKKAAQIAEFLGLSDSSYFRKKVLKNLVDEGYLVLSNSSGTGFYRTNHEAVRQG